MSAINLFKDCRKIIGFIKQFVDPGAPSGIPPTEPIWFLKSPTSMIPEGKSIIIPKCCPNILHEVELGVVIGLDGSDISEDQAMKHIAGYTLALDMTSGFLLGKLTAQSHPWALAKSWDTFCPISDIIHPDKIPDPQNVDLWLKVNGEIKQSANTKDMIFPVSRLISYCSKIMKLERGDMILTGTPSGIGPVNSGEVIECALNGIKEMKFNVE